MCMYIYMQLFFCTNEFIDIMFWWCSFFISIFQVSIYSLLCVLQQRMGYEFFSEKLLFFYVNIYIYV